ncbi:MAG: hypothetical protein LBN37_01750 [Bacteroidales bacterium]|jgi:hypothetical protein|nr:hypothetical protein [Bacteroidales bacterium]
MTADIKQLSEKKIPIVKIDKKLEQFKNKILFPNKLEMANRILGNAGLPVLH